MVIFKILPEEGNRFRRSNIVSPGEVHEDTYYFIEDRKEIWKSCTSKKDAELNTDSIIELEGSKYGPKHTYPASDGTHLKVPSQNANFRNGYICIWSIED